jgi:hypothetical protein
LLPGFGDKTLYVRLPAPWKTRAPVSQPSEPQVRRLLNDAKLPTADLTAEHLKHFIGCGLEQAPKGVVGLEIYGPDALLRLSQLKTKHEGRDAAKLWWRRPSAMLMNKACAEFTYSPPKTTLSDSLRPK